VNDWRFAQKDASEQLAELHLFSFKKCVSGVEIDFTITVKEFAAPPPGQYFRFFAQADKPINQKIAPFLASGWGNSILEALTGCTRAIREFPCERSSLFGNDRKRVNVTSLLRARDGLRPNATRTQFMSQE
jgi:hypothetical protein